MNYALTTNSEVVVEGHVGIELWNYVRQLELCESLSNPPRRLKKIVVNHSRFYGLLFIFLPYLFGAKLLCVLFHL